MKPAGMYNWAGPGTIRMIQLKYPGHRIDYTSLMNAYEPHQLEAAKGRLSVTDAWVTYSWGFNEQTEQADYQFIRQRLANFHKAGIRTHAYVQGFNLVLDDHLERDYWCRDYWGRFIPYHRGRKMACPNNPHFRAYLRHKVSLALEEDFDGVFVDNLFLGQMPLIVANRHVSFFGCACSYCQLKFKQEFGLEIPMLYGLHTDELKAYQQFRVDSILSVAQELADLVHSRGKLFGSNVLDPKNDPQLYYGVDLDQLQPLQDYLLFENHDLPRLGRNNTHLKSLITRYSNKPIYIVSYKHGIGREPLFVQADFDAVYTESQRLGYSPAYKASEFTHNRTWLNYDFNSIEPVRLVPDLNLDELVERASKSLGFAPLAKLYSRSLVPFMETYYENRLMRRGFNWLYYRAIQ